MLKTSRAKIGGLFARDPASYQNLCRLELPPSVKIGLGHDPAFHLRNSKWITELREACSSEYVLACFRGDRESAMPLPRANRLFRTWPFSSLFYRYKRHCQKRNFLEYYHGRLNVFRQRAGSNLPLLEQDVSCLNFQLFVESVSRAGQVHTDRLHCMIMALLLGKEVFAYPTSYAKLEGVYEQSIKSWAKVHFAGKND